MQNYFHLPAISLCRFQTVVNCWNIINKARIERAQNKKRPKILTEPYNVTEFSDNSRKIVHYSNKKELLHSTIPEGALVGLLVGCQWSVIISKPDKFVA